jgi:saposin
VKLFLLIENILKTKKAICELLNQCDYEGSSVDPRKSNHEPKNEKIFDIDGFDLRFKCGIHPRNWCNTIETARQCNATDYCLINWSKSPVKYHVKQIPVNEMMKKESEPQRICSFCIFVFTKIQSVVLNNATEETILNYLEGSCNLLPQQDLVNSCLQDVDKYLPEIYNMVRNNVDPGIICRVLKACKDEYLEYDKPDDSTEQMADQILKTLKVMKVGVKSWTKPQIYSKLEPRLMSSSGVACELCEIVLTASKYLIENKINEDKVLTFIESQLCARLGSLNETCVQYVKEEGATILDLLIHNVDPEVVCRAMGLCSKVQVNEKNIIKQLQFFDLNVRDNVNCTTCEMVIEGVKAKLTNKTSQAEIIDVNIFNA